MYCFICCWCFEGFHWVHRQCLTEIDKHWITTERLNAFIHWMYMIYISHMKSLRPRQNRRHFADDVFKCNFLNENVWIPIKISLKFVPKGPINNIPALVQIMAWRRSGDKPLSEPMMVGLPTHICVTRPQWVKRRHWPIWKWKWKQWNINESKTEKYQQKYPLDSNHWFVGAKPGNTGKLSSILYH